MYRALIVGAGRIGAAYRWHDDTYTHPGAIRANSDRVTLAAFVEPDRTRGGEAMTRWEVPSYTSLTMALDIVKPDIVCVATQPEQQKEVLTALVGKVKAAYVEKPYMGGKYPFPIQVNYIRRGDAVHRLLADFGNTKRTLHVAGKTDIHTTCHFDDLADWWDAELKYLPHNGPNSYILYDGTTPHVFRNGGVDGGECMKALLCNLLDHLDNGTPLWSPAHHEA